MKYQDTGKFIVNLRKEKNMSQQELADKLNYSFTNISKWETGRSCPTPEALLALSEEFDVSIEELLAGKRKNKDNQKEINKNMYQKLLKDKKIKSMFHIIIALMVMLCSFICIYFIFIKNTVVTYNVRGENEEFYTLDGIFLITNKNIILSIPFIKSINNKSIDAYCLYTEKNNRKHYLFCRSYSKENPSIYYNEKRGYNEFFNVALDEVINNLHISVLSEDTVSIIDIKTKEIYTNDAIFGKRVKQVGNPYNSNWQSRYGDLLLNNGFKKENDIYSGEANGVTIKYIDIFDRLIIYTLDGKFTYKNEDIYYENDNCNFIYNIEYKTFSMNDCNKNEEIIKDFMKLARDTFWWKNRNLIYSKKKNWE